MKGECGGGGGGGHGGCFVVWCSRPLYFWAVGEVFEDEGSLSQRCVLWEESVCWCVCARERERCWVWNLICCRGGR